MLGSSTCFWQFPWYKTQTDDWLRCEDSTTPEWDEVPYDLNLGLGDSIKINCSAHGTPEPIIRWSKITHQGESSIFG